MLGVGMSFVSGADSAMLYDTLLVLNREGNIVVERGEQQYWSFVGKRSKYYRRISCSGKSSAADSLRCACLDLHYSCSAYTR